MTLTMDEMEDLVKVATDEGRAGRTRVAAANAVLTQVGPEVARSCVLRAIRAVRLDGEVE
jgi:hypothetical protein